MINRRELLLAGAAATFVHPRPLTSSFRFPFCVAHLEAASERVLTGLPAGALTPTSAHTTAPLSVRVRGATGLVSWSGGREVPLAFMNGGASFVAAWVLPVISPGYIGFDPGADLPLLLQAGGGEFWNLGLDEVRPPRSVRTARAMMITFVGAFESLHQLDAAVRRLSEPAPKDADLLFTANLEAHLPPSALVSVFGAG